MEPLQLHDHSIQTFSFFCKDSFSFKTRLALLTFYRVKYPISIEKSILLLEYLQLMSQVALLYENSKNNSHFVEIILYLFKLANPSFLLSWGNSDVVTSTVLVMIFCCTLLKLLLLANAIFCSLKNREMNPWLQNLWRWIYKSQTRVLYFLFTSFWVHALSEASNRGFALFGISKAPVMLLGSLILALEFLFSVIIETQLCYFVETKDFLASKNNHLQITTFFQKFIVQLIFLMFRSNSVIWITCIVGLAFDTMKLWIYFRELPLYNISALWWQKSLLTAMISGNLASFIQMILKSHDHIGANMSFFIIIWILLTALIDKVSGEILKCQIVSLILTNKQKGVRLLLHKVSLTKQFYHNEKIPTSNTMNYDLSYLILMQQKINIGKIFGLPEDDPETMNRIYFLYYQELSERFPDDILVKLHYAYTSFKQGDSYPKVLKIISEIQKQKWWSSDHLGCSLLLYEIEKSIKNTLDFSRFIKSRISMERLRENMLEQTDLQMNICSNILNKTCDIEEIHSCAQKISHSKVLIQKKIDKLSKELSEHDISPYLIFAEYHLAVNHSISDFRKYYEIYIQKYSKVKRYFKELDLQQENIYQASNVMLLLSTQKGEYGKILYESSSLANICGGQRVYKGVNISTIFPPSLRQHYDELFKQNHESLLNQVSHAYLLNKDDGYLVEANFSLKYHPYLAQGLCLCMILRPAPAFGTSDFLLLNESGDIEGASKDLMRVLNLKNPMIPIKAISDQLDLGNNTFNIISDQKVDNHEIELYAFHSQKVRQQERESFKFYSQIHTLVYGDLKMKLIQLKPITLGSERNYFTEKEEFPEDFSEIEEYFKFELHNENLADEVGVAVPILRTERKHLITNASPRFTTNQSTSLDGFSIRADVSFYGSSQSTPTIKSAEKAENKIFKLAILSKSYPRSFTSLCFIFYLVILLTFVSQLIMKSVSDSTMKDLQIRKSLLKFSEERCYRGGLLQILGPGIVLLLKNAIEVGEVYVDIGTVVQTTQPQIINMKQANSLMLDYVYSLDEATQKELFRQDVRINGTFYESEDAVHKYVNLFDLTEEVAVAVQTLNSLSDFYTGTALSIGNYLTVNLADDFLYESARITEILTETVERQKEAFQNLTNLFLILNPFLLTAIGILLCSIIWNQQRIEKKNLKAFIKIPTEGVQAVAYRLGEFRRSLITQETFLKTWASAMKRDLQTLHRGERTSAYSKKAVTQTIIYEAFHKRYFKYIIRVVACISLLVIITIWDLVETHQAIKVIYNRQSQLQFANYLSNRVMVTFITYVELFERNHTLKVERLDPYEGLVRRTELLKQLGAEIPSKFLEADGLYNPEVQRILFENNPHCRGFKPDFIHFCQVLADAGQAANIITTVAAFQNRMATKIQDYLVANKSTPETLLAAGYWGEPPVSYCLTITEEAHRIASIMDKSITRKIGEMQNGKNNIIIIFSIGLCFVGFLIWLYLLKVIREVHNDFKKVLQIFPPNLVLSSYLIQRFLRETSPNGFFWK